MNDEEEEFNNHLEQQNQSWWWIENQDVAWISKQQKQTEEHNPWKTG